MTNCPNCQNEVPEIAKVCGYCGHSLIAPGKPDAEYLSADRAERPISSGKGSVWPYLGTLFLGLFILFEAASMGNAWSLIVLSAIFIIITFLGYLRANRRGLAIAILASAFVASLSYLLWWYGIVPRLNFLLSAMLNLGLPLLFLWALADAIFAKRSA